MRQAFIYFVFLLSGAAGLVYELVWVRELIFVFGGTTYAITTVLVAFMGGLGLGSFVAGRAGQGLKAPGRLYGLLELGVGLYALLIPLLFTVVEPVYRGLYPHLATLPWLLNLVRFGVSALILIVPTTCMGATLPVLVRYVTSHGADLGRSVGRLYGTNTLGAVLGVALAGYWLIPTCGLLRTTLFAAAANILIGLAAICILRPYEPPPRRMKPETRRGTQATPARPVTITRAERYVLLVGFAVSGFAAMVYQIAWTRALIQSLGSSTYAFTSILLAFILGLALGSLAVSRWVDRWNRLTLIIGVLEIAIGLSAVLIVPVYGRIPFTVESLITRSAGDYGALLRWQLLLVIAITIVPTLLMGAVFPLVTRALAAHREEAAAATGRAYAINTLGTIAGSFLAGFVLIRSAVLGVQNSITLASALNGLVGVALILLARPATAQVLLRRAALAIPALLLIPIVALVGGRWDPRVLSTAPFLQRTKVADQAANQEVIYLEEGVDLTVAIVHPTGRPEGISLLVNGKPDASTGGTDMLTQLLLGHVPALLGTQGQTACVIGLGSGMTLSALACYPYEQLDCVEISEEVIRAAAYFDPYTNNVLHADPRVRMIPADGRNHLLLTDQRYDLIGSEPSNPWMVGVSNLFTREFFELCRSRLTDNGLLAVWLHGYQMSARNFQMVIHTLFSVFDHVSLWHMVGGEDYVLIASAGPIRTRLQDFESRFNLPTVRTDLARVSIFRPAQILGRYVAADGALRELTAAMPIHTDDNALLEFSAPRYLYADQSTEIAALLLPLQGHVLTDFLAPSEHAPSAELEAEIGAVAAAQWADGRAFVLNRQGDPAGGLQVLLDTFARSPFDVALHESLIKVRGPLMANRPRLETNPELAALFKRLDQVVPPRCAPLTARTTADLATFLRGVAQDASHAGAWMVASDHFVEAWKLEPDHVATARAAAVALMRAGRVPQAANLLDEVLRQHAVDGETAYLRALLALQLNDRAAAVQHLVTALQTGVVNAETLATSNELRPLRDDPQIKALLERPPANTRPATQP